MAAFPLAKADGLIEALAQLEQACGIQLAKSFPLAKADGLIEATVP